MEENSDKVVSARPGVKRPALLCLLSYVQQMDPMARCEYCRPGKEKEKKEWSKK